MIKHLKNIAENIQKHTPHLKGKVKTGVYWHIGRMLVSEERKKNMQEDDVKVFLASLEQDLSFHYGKLYSFQSLWKMRQFCLAFPDWESLTPALSWSHYQLLSEVEDDDARTFYTDEALINNWNVLQLKRQIQSKHFERRSDFEPLKDILQNEYVLEFTKTKATDSESVLEAKLIEQLQTLLTELGTGFSFVAQQKRIVTPAGNTYIIDLVFYHFVKKCFVLIDLKTKPLTHQNLGQMDLYIRLYDDKWKSLDDQPTIGILLCPKVSSDLKDYSLLKGHHQLFASTFQLKMPTTESSLKLNKNLDWFKRILEG